jgi:hypothetical protein
MQQDRQTDTAKPVGAFYRFLLQARYQHSINVTSFTNTPRKQETVNYSFMERLTFSTLQ